MRWLLVFLLACLLFNVLQGWMAKVGLGKLPGDFRFRLAGREWFVPLTSSIVLTMLASVIGLLI
jgi:Protein of unknown function (DUF2905)